MLSNNTKNISADTKLKYKSQQSVKNSTHKEVNNLQINI